MYDLVTKVFLTLCFLAWLDSGFSSEEGTFKLSVDCATLSTGSPSKTVSLMRYHVSRYKGYPKGYLAMHINTHIICSALFLLRIFIAQPTSSPTVRPSNSPTKEVSTSFVPIDSILTLAVISQTLTFLVSILFASFSSHSPRQVQACRPRRVQVKGHQFLPLLVQQRCQRDRHQSR